MQIFRHLDELPKTFGPVVATIGNFDGVHRGHQWVIDRVKARARALGAPRVVVVGVSGAAEVTSAALVWMSFSFWFCACMLRSSSEASRRIANRFFCVDVNSD